MLITPITGCARAIGKGVLSVTAHCSLSGIWSRNYRLIRSACCASGSIRFITRKTFVISSFRDERWKPVRGLRGTTAGSGNGRKAIKRAAGIEEVYVDRTTNSHVREVGAEWLGLQACRQLLLPEYFESTGWDKESAGLAITQVISRAVYPASEYKTNRWLKENSALCELTGTDASTITKDKLYGMAHRLYREKNGLEHHLSTRTNDLFSLDDRILIFDLTNTYFEGRMNDSRLAKFGRGKEKRNDAKQVVLAAVVNREGFLKESQILGQHLRP